MARPHTAPIKSSLSTFEPNIRLGPSMKKVLAFLLEQREPVFASDIRDATHLPSGSISPVVARFEEVGIVQLELTDKYWHNPAEGFQRRTSVMLTDAARSWGDRQLRQDAYRPKRRGRRRVR